MSIKSNLSNIKAHCFDETELKSHHLMVSWWYADCSL